MDLRIFAKLAMLISVSLLPLEARADRSSRSVVFFDSPSHSFIRHQPLGITDETKSILLDEVAAAVSVLLGLAPSSSLPADSSSKLNEVLLPNPFERPDIVFLLEVGGIDGLFLSKELSNLKVSSSFSSMVLGSEKTRIDVPGEDVYVIHVDETACAEDDDSCADKELSELAEWFGGSYTGCLMSHDGKLTIPLSSGSSLDLHIAKKADRIFATSLASLVENTKRAALLNEFSQSSMRSAKLFIGHFRGLEVLEVEYGQGDSLELGTQLVKESLIKLFNTLQASSGGRVVSVVVSSKYDNPNTKSMLEVAQSPRFSRWLDETSYDNETSAEIISILLVRRTLAWITAIILLVSTLIGICLLKNMSLTRDTLLYSNVKLD